MSVVGCQMFAPTARYIRIMSMCNNGKSGQVGVGCVVCDDNDMVIESVSMSGGN